MIAVPPWLHAVLDRRQWTPPPLYFPAAQEHRYIEATRGSRLTHFMRSGWVALLCYNFFLLADWLMVPDAFAQAVQVRLLGFTPVAVLILLLVSLGRRWVLAWPDAVTELVVVFSGVLAALSLVLILYLSSSEVALLYRAGLVPILVYGNLVQRFRFRWAVWFTLSVLAVYGLGFVLHLGRDGPYQAFELSQFLFVTAIGLYTLAANYRIELEDRRRFDHAERAAWARERLEESRRELDALSRRDALTGVPNRRQLDEYLLQQWRAPGNQGQPLSILLLDVDHFKAFNDRYGHPAGDQCLQHVAQALAKALGPVRGLLARWGAKSSWWPCPTRGQRLRARSPTACEPPFRPCNCATMPHRCRWSRSVWAWRLPGSQAMMRIWSGCSRWPMLPSTRPKQPDATPVSLLQATTWLNEFPCPDGRQVRNEALKVPLGTSPASSSRT